jgi:hypothetical protein
VSNKRQGAGRVASAGNEVVGGIIFAPVTKAGTVPAQGDMDSFAPGGLGGAVLRAATVTCQTAREHHYFRIPMRNRMREPGPRGRG